MISEVFLWSGIVLKFIGMLFFALSVLPRMWKQAQVPNGLGFLRKALFVCAFVYFLTQCIGLTTFFTNPQEVDGILEIVKQSLYFNILSFINNFGFFLISITLHLIYTKDYTHEHRR